MITVKIQDEDFSLQEEYQRLRSTTSGAIVIFSGLVREFDSQGDGAGVESLHLQHYPGMTERLLGEIVDEACGRWPLQAVTVIHRVGTLLPGDQIVLVAVSSAHREAAFAGANFVMDYLKTRATLWKKTVTAEGGRWLDTKEGDREAARRWRESGEG